MSGWQAGAYEVDITPPLDVPLGSGFDPPQACGVADPLRARALVLSDGAERIALVNCDILAIDRVLSADIRERVAGRTGIAPGQVMVSATHTHSCGGRLQPSRGNGDPALLEILGRKMAGAVAEAARNLRPAVISTGSVRVPGITRNRRDPDAPVDDRLRILRVDGPHGLLAVLTVFAAHPILVAHDRPVISADFPGMMAGMLRATLGPSVVVLPANGVCGDVNPVVRSNSGLESARWIAQRLAGESLALLARLEAAGGALRTDNTRWGLTLEVDADGGARLTPARIRAGSITVRVPCKEFGRPSDLSDAATRAADRLLEAGADAALVQRWQAGRSVPAETEQGLTDDARAARRRLTSELLRRRSAVWSARVAEHQELAAAPFRELEAQAFALGEDAAVLGVPFELFSRVGLEIHAASPFPHLLLMTYANDLGGYLMPDDEHERGGFEAGITFYGRGAADVVRNGCLTLLRDLAEPAHLDGTPGS